VHLRVVAIATLGLALTVALPAQAAAPRLIVIHGEGLTHPIVLTDWWGNLALMGGDAVHTFAWQLRDRPYFELALFWDPKWDMYVRNGNSLEDIAPNQADQEGRFYPATGTDQAIMALDGALFMPARAWRLSADSLEILARAGVPVRSEPPSGLTLALGPFSVLATLLIVAGGIAAVAVGRRLVAQQIR
jgi:hypothetical protein